MVALVRQRRRIRTMVVTGYQQHATMLAGTCVVGMFQHINRAVYTRPFGVPHAKHAIVGAGANQADLLCSPHGG